jgi:hypothetical protein
MFFMRIRRHARWVFILLALVFALAFAFAGVGSGSTGVGDMLGGFSFFGSGSPDPVKAAQKKVDKAGKDSAKLAPALLELGKAQAAKDTTDKAEATYLRYLALRPKDATARHNLALLYQKDADAQYSQLQAVTNDVVQSAPASEPASKLVTDPISAGIHSDAVQKATDFYKAYSAAKHKELDVLAAAVGLARGTERSNILAQLGPEGTTAVNTALTFSSYVPESPQAATAQQDGSTWAGQAIVAYKALLKLNQSTALKAQIQQRITELKPFAPTPAKSAGS